MSESSASPRDPVDTDPSEKPLKPAQQEALQQLKDKVKAEYLDEALSQGKHSATEHFLTGDDKVYLRFLRARRYDVDKAFEMLMTAAKWRRDFQDGRGVEDIDEQSIENELATGKSFFYKYDKNERPVVYIRPRLHKSGSITQDELERFIVWHMEIGRELSKPGVETNTIIYDMADFGLSNMDYNLVKTQIHMLHNFYPETLGTILILNSPWLFRGCWALIKGWIDPYAVKKIHFISMPDLLTYIDEDSLLTDYGGKDPFQYEYIPVSKREELGRTDFKPTWLMDWAVGWRKDAAKSSSVASSSSSESDAETRSATGSEADVDSIAKGLHDQTVETGTGSHEPKKDHEASEAVHN